MRLGYLLYYKVREELSQRARHPKVVEIPNGLPHDHLEDLAARGLK